VIEAALIGQPDAVLLVEFSGDEQQPCCCKAPEALVELMADLGLPGAWSRCSTTSRRRHFWEVARRA
jgi:hypothetical protein